MCINGNVVYAVLGADFGSRFSDKTGVWGSSLHFASKGEMLSAIVDYHNGLVGRVRWFRRVDRNVVRKRVVDRIFSLHLGHILNRRTGYSTHGVSSQVRR